MGWLRRKFLTGIVALAPIGITAWVLYKFFTAVDTKVTPLVAKWIGFEIPGLGFAATILFVLLAGVFASNIFGRTVIVRFEDLFARVPLFSRIYLAVEQIGEAILTSQKNVFERVVLFEYPRRGSWAVGFVTSEHRGVLHRQTGKEHVHVFVPTTPNPTSGFLLFLPLDDVVELDMTVEDGLKLVVSGGAVTPPGYGRTLPGARQVQEPAETAAVSEKS